MTIISNKPLSTQQSIEIISVLKIGFKKHESPSRFELGTN